MKTLSEPLEYTFYIKHQDNDNVVMNTLQDGKNIEIIFDLINNTCSEKGGEVIDVGNRWKRCIYRSNKILGNFFGSIA